MGSVWCTITRCVVLSLSFGLRSCDILGRGIRGAEREICTALAPELHWGGGGGGIWTSLRHTARGSEWTVLGFRNSGVQVGQERNIRALLTFKGPDASLAVTDRVKEDPRKVHHCGFDLLSTDNGQRKQSKRSYHDTGGGLGVSLAGVRHYGFQLIQLHQQGPAQWKTIQLQLCQTFPFKDSAALLRQWLRSSRLLLINLRSTSPWNSQRVPRGHPYKHVLT